MKIKVLASIIILLSCNTGNEQNKSIDKEKFIVTDSSKISITNGILIDTSGKNIIPKKMYANQRFKEVTVENISDKKFRIKGKAQVFEAAFSWVIEDGHNEIKTGYQMTDAGAPAWGNFNFTIDALKETSNSTLHIILFEASPKDGSRQYELPILLY